MMVIELTSSEYCLELLQAGGGGGRLSEYAKWGAGRKCAGWYFQVSTLGRSFRTHPGRSRALPLVANFLPHVALWWRLCVRTHWSQATSHCSQQWHPTQASHKEPKPSDSKLDLIYVHLPTTCSGRMFCGTIPSYILSSQVILHATAPLLGPCRR